SWHEVPGALQPVSRGQNNSINGTTLHMNSTTDGWLGEAADSANPQNVYLYHFDGTTWHLVTIPVANSAGSEISAITFLPDGEGWASGLNIVPANYGVALHPIRPLILHFFNGSWSVQLS